MTTFYGLDQIRVAREILESSDRALHERLLAAANSYWNATRFFNDWPVELQGATDPIHRMILVKPSIAESVAAMSEEDVLATMELIHQFALRAEAIAGESD